MSSDSREVMYYLRSRSPNRGAVGGPPRVPGYVSICFSVHRARLKEGMGAHNPRLSLTCITGTDKIVYDCVAFA